MKYKSKSGGFIPEIGIVFCGNRAVITSRMGNKPEHHTDVFYGMFFWIRLGLSCARVYYKGINY